MPRARISLGGRNVHLGYFNTEEECARAKEVAERAKVRADPRGRGPEYSEQLKEAIVAEATAAVTQLRELHSLVDSLPVDALPDMHDILSGNGATADISPQMHCWHYSETFAPVSSAPVFAEPVSATNSQRIKKEPMDAAPATVCGTPIVSAPSFAPRAASSAPSFNPKGIVERGEAKLVIPPTPSSEMVEFSPLRACLAKLGASLCAILSACRLARTPNRPSSPTSTALVPYSPVRAWLSLSKWALVALAALVLAALFLDEVGTFAHHPRPVCDPSLPPPPAPPAPPPPPHWDGGAVWPYTVSPPPPSPAPPPYTDSDDDQDHLFAKGAVVGAATVVGVILAKTLLVVAFSGRRLDEPILPLGAALDPTGVPCVGGAAADSPPSYLAPSTLNHFMAGEVVGVAAILVGVIVTGLLLLKLIQLLLQRCPRGAAERTPRAAPAVDYDPFPATPQPPRPEALHGGESKSRELV